MPRSAGGSAGRRLSVAAKPPFRLDLTVAALQRRDGNPVDLWAEGRYLRAFETARGPVVWEIRQPEGVAALALRLHGQVGEPAPWTKLAARMLGTGVELGPFLALATGQPALARLARRFRGVKPPRFASLWESLVNAIAFQQLSLASAMATVRRLAGRCAPAVPFGGLELRPFPSAQAVSRLREAELRGLGFSEAKSRALAAAARAILSGELQEPELEQLPDEALASRLRELPGIGPWTAALVLLRGFGRLGVFPAGDSGAARGLERLWPGLEAGPLLRWLGPWRGMLYFHLLLAGRFGMEESRP